MPQLADITGSLRALLQQWQALGLDFMQLPASQSQSAAAEPQAHLAALEASLHSCQQCSLAHSRRHVLPGQGVAPAQLVVLTEAPGDAADKHGDPWAGRSGVLLQEALQAIGLLPSHVYLTSIVKCRPSHQRPPKAAEVAACLPFLHQQLQWVRPQALLVLGENACQALLGSQVSLQHLRGQWQKWQGLWLLPTLSCRYLLQHPDDKWQLWEDLKTLRHFLAS